MASPSDQLYNLHHMLLHVINLWAETLFSYVLVLCRDVIVIIIFALLPPGAVKSRGGICHPQDWRKNLFPPIWISSNLMVTLNWIEVNFVLTLYKTWQEPKNVVLNSEMYSSKILPSSKMIATSFEKVWGNKISTLRISLLIYDERTKC